MTATGSTPVIVGVGQVSERLEDDDYQALSPADLAAEAARLALAEAGLDPRELDVLVCPRQFDESGPGVPARLGRPDFFPGAVASRIGAERAHTVYTTTGGESPQRLVTEYAGRIATGQVRAVLIVTSEAISTVRHLAGRAEAPDFAETVPGGPHDDRGHGLEGIMTGHQVRHGLTAPPGQYALIENARRVATGRTRAEQTAAIGAWMAPFTQVAAQNPHAAVRSARSAEELTTVDEGNRMIADPYPLAVCAREKVNQGAAVLLVAGEVADALDVTDRVYLHGACDLRDREILRRPELGGSVPAVRAVHTALERAGITLDDVAVLDLYSCFPIAVSAVAEDLGLAPDDPRGLTVTGGLPFFGGPGNGYSLHAIAEIVERCRRHPGSFGLVGANGGLFTKYSVGIYATTPRPWAPTDDAPIQAALDAVSDVVLAPVPHGWGRIEAWTVTFGPAGRTAIVVGRLDDERRFIATQAPGDDDVVDLLLGDDAPGARVWVEHGVDHNVVRLTRPTPQPADPFAEHPAFTVTRAGRVLEVTVRGAFGNGALTTADSQALAGVFDAFEGDPALQVAILTGTGGAFCSSTDDAAPSIIVGNPSHGFAGITARALTKPVIAAIEGPAVGSAFELALACTFVVAAEPVEFSLPLVRSCDLPINGAAARLPAVLPPAVARRVLLTGAPLSADDALRHGWLSEVTAPGQTLNAARRLADDLLLGAPTAQRAALRAVAIAEQIGDPVASIWATQHLADDLATSADGVRGQVAQATGEPAVWTGR